MQNVLAICIAFTLRIWQTLENRVDPNQIPHNVPSDLDLYNLVFVSIRRIYPGPSDPGYILPANSVDPDQLASEEANWSGSALFVIKYVNLYQQPWSSNLIG